MVLERADQADRNDGDAQLLRDAEAAVLKFADVAVALPRACSSVAFAISAIEVVDRAVSSRIFSSTPSARAVRPTP